jgi:hypothetical protein
MNDGNLMNRYVNHRLLPPPLTLAISIKNMLGMLHKMINNVIFSMMFISLNQNKVPLGSYPLGDM